MSVVKKAILGRRHGTTAEMERLKLFCMHTILIALLSSCFVNAEADKLHEFASKRSRYAKVALNRTGSKILTIVFNESDVTGKRFDLVYADTDFDGRFEPTEKLAPKPRVSANREFLIAAFGPLKLDVPYDSKTQVVPNPCILNLQWTKRPREASATDSFDISAAIRIRRGSVLWKYRLWAFWHPLSTNINSAQVLRFNDHPRLNITTAKISDGRDKGKTAIRVARVLIGDWNLIDCIKQSRRPKANILIKKANGRIIHQSSPNLSQLWGSNVYSVSIPPGRYSLEITTDIGPLGGVVRTKHSFEVKHR